MVGAAEDIYVFVCRGAFTGSVKTELAVSSDDIEMDRFVAILNTIPHIDQRLEQAGGVLVVTVDNILLQLCRQHAAEQILLLA